jgi:hypothetical protein
MFHCKIFIGGESSSDCVFVIFVLKKSYMFLFRFCLEPNLVMSYMIYKLPFSTGGFT